MATFDENNFFNYIFLNIFIDSNLIAKSKKDILFLSTEGKVSKKEINQLKEQALDAYSNGSYKKSESMKKYFV